MRKQSRRRVSGVEEIANDAQRFMPALEHGEGPVKLHGIAPLAAAHHKLGRPRGHAIIRQHRQIALTRASLDEVPTATLAASALAAAIKEHPHRSRFGRRTSRKRRRPLALWNRAGMHDFHLIDIFWFAGGTIIINAAFPAARASVAYSP